MMDGRNIKTDRGRCWMVAFCCCFCNMVFYGVARLSGIVLVTAIQTFNVSRASASVPFTLGSAIRSLTGLFVGHLGHRFGVGRVVAVGCLIASLGSGLCFFAVDMTLLNVCWGIIFGIGYGFCTCLLPVAINQNFSKHNGIASGISYSGAYIGSFIFPPIIVTLLGEFGLQGTFLIISGFLLNVLVAAILLSTPKHHRQRASYHDTFDGKLRSVSDIYNSETLAQNENYESKSSSIVSSTNPEIFGTHEFKSIGLHMCSACRLYLTKENNQCLHPVENSLQSERLTVSICCTSDKESPKHLSHNNTDTACNPYNSHTLSSTTEAIPEKYTYTAENRSASCFGHCVKRDMTTLTKLTIRGGSGARKKNLKMKLKDKCKLKLHFTKKILRTPILKTFNIKSESSDTGVNLLSFKVLQPIWHPVILVSSKNLAVSPHKEPINLRKNCKSFFIITKQTRKYTIERPTDVINKNNRPENTITNNIGNSKATNLMHSTSVTSNTNAANSTFYSSGIKDTTTIDKNSECNCPKISETKDLEHIFLQCKENTSYSFLDNYLSQSDEKCNGELSSNSCKQFQELKPSLLEANMPDFTLSKRDRRKKILPDWVRMYCKPMFLVISCTMSIQTFTVNCVLTTIEDYAKDVGIEENKVHYTLMALSIANLIGTLTMGFFTDRGIISRHHFISLCFLGMSIALIAISELADSLQSLLSIVVIYGLLESGVIITFPILTKQFIKGERRQAIAIASSNALSAPTVMLVPLLIGYFRDDYGCYSGLFHLSASMTLFCSLAWCFAPYICGR